MIMEVRPSLTHRFPHPPEEDAVHGNNLNELYNEARMSQPINKIEDK